MKAIISRDQIEFLFDGRDIIRIPFSQYPMLMYATVEQLLDAQIDEGEIHFYRLDVDIALESLAYPEKYPLRFSPKIISVEALDGYRLRLKFDNGVEKMYDCSPLLQNDIFRPLTDTGLFLLVKVSAGGYGIEWNDEIDLAESELWSKGLDFQAK
jgi:hypothetical protein